MGKREQDKGQKRAVFTPRAGILFSSLLPFLSIPLRYFRSFVASHTHCAVHVPRFSSILRRTMLDGRLETRDAPFDATRHTCVHVCTYMLQPRRLESVERERGKGVCAKVHRKLGISQGGAVEDRIKIQEYEVRASGLKRLKT